MKFKQLSKFILSLLLTCTSISTVKATDDTTSPSVVVSGEGTTEVTEGIKEEQVEVNWCSVGQFATGYAINKGYKQVSNVNDVVVSSASKAYIPDTCYDSYVDAVAKARTMEGTEEKVPVVISLLASGERIAYAKYGVVYLNNSSSSATFGIYTEPNSTLRKTYVNATSQQDAVLIDMVNIGWAKVTMAGVTGYLKLTNTSGTFIHQIIPTSFLDKTTMIYDDIEYTGYRVTRYGASATDSTAMYLDVLRGTKNSSLVNSGTADKPSFMKSGVVYYNYDGHYFYDSLKDMIDDRLENTYSRALNSTPYYNYYQYLPARAKTNMSSTDFNNFLILNKPTAGDKVTYCYTSNGGTTSCSNSHAYKYSGPSSILYNNGSAFLTGQDNYGINAALIYVKATLEGAYGMSTIARAKYNPFGVNAVDSAPFTSATKYNSVYEGVESQFKKIMSLGYANPYDAGGRYNGSHTGDKNSGINTLYASDPNWGFKLASIYRQLDSMSGFRDLNYYQLAVTTTPKAILYTDKEASEVRVVLQHYNTINNYVFENIDIPLIIVDSVTNTVNGKKMYKVVVDTPSDQSTGLYYGKESDYGYVYASDVMLINTARDGYKDPKDVGNIIVDNAVDVETFTTPIVVSNDSKVKLYDSYRTDISTSYTEISKGKELVAIRTVTANSTKYYEVIVDYTKQPYRTMWVKASDVSVEKDVELVTTQASMLNCREDATTSSESLGLIRTERSPLIYLGKKEGAAVKENTTWYKVLFNPLTEDVGYISSVYATIDESGEDTSSGSTGGNSSSGSTPIISPSDKTKNIVYNLFFNEKLYVFGTGVVEGLNTPDLTSATYEIVFTAEDGTKYTYPLSATTTTESLTESPIFNPERVYNYTYSWYEGNINLEAVGKNGTLTSLPSGTYVMEVAVTGNGTTTTFPMVNARNLPLGSDIVVNDTMKYSVTHNNYGELSMVVVNETKQLDLSDYTNEMLDVYPNSRVTSMTYSNGVLNLEGYAFIKDRGVPTNDYQWLWREVIFVNEDNSSRDYAYRVNVTPINKGSFLTKNTTLNPTGKYSYAMATYKVSANSKSINNYDQKKSSIAPGKYRVYVRCSDGVNGKLFPLKDVTLSDGTNLENTGKLPVGFEIVDPETRELRLIVE